MLKNVLGKWLEILLSTASVFILYPFLVSNIGEDQYGVWLLINSITGYFQLLALGVPLSTVRHISKYWAQKDYDKVNEVVGTCLVVYGIIALIVLALGSGLALGLDTLFEIPQAYVRPAKIAALIATATIACSFLFEVLEGTIHAQQKQFVLAMIRSALVLTRTVATLLLVRHDNGLYVIALVLAGSVFAQGVVMAVYVRRHYPVMRFSLAAGTKAMAKEIFHYSMWALVMSLAGLISFRTDPIVIGSVLSVGLIVYFSVANNLLLYLSEVMEGIAQALMPRVSSMEARKEITALAPVYLEYSRLTYLIMQAVCVMFIVLGGDFIALWMGEEFRGPAGRVLIILALAYQFYLVQRGVGVAILLGIGSIKVPTLLMVGAAVLNAVVSVILAMFWGIEGVAWGTTIPLWLLSAALLVYTSRLLHVSVGRYVLHAYVIPSLISPLLIVPPLLFKLISAVDSFPKFVGVAGVSTLAYCVAAFYLLPKNQQSGLLRMLPGRRRTVEPS